MFDQTSEKGTLIEARLKHYCGTIDAEDQVIEKKIHSINQSQQGIHVS